MLKAVVFDVEGTLLDSIEHRALAWRDALREFGANVEPADLTPHVAGPEREIPRRFLQPAVLAEVTAERVIERYRDAWENVHAPNVQPIPHGRALVEELRSAGIRVALATRAHESRLPDLLKRADLVGLAEAAGIPEGLTHSPKAGRPSEGPTDGNEGRDAEDLSEREVLVAAQALAEAGPGETLAVVHGASDARAAKALGMRVVGLLSGGTDRATLEGAGAEHVFASPQEMLENLSDLASLGFPTKGGDAPRSPRTTYNGPTDHGDGRKS